MSCAARTVPTACVWSSVTEWLGVGVEEEEEGEEEAWVTSRAAPVSGSTFQTYPVKCSEVHRRSVVNETSTIWCKKSRSDVIFWVYFVFFSVFVWRWRRRRRRRKGKRKVGELSSYWGGAEYKKGYLIICVRIKRK